MSWSGVSKVSIVLSVLSIVTAVISMVLFARLKQPPYHKSIAIALLVWIMINSIWSISGESSYRLARIISIVLSCFALAGSLAACDESFVRENKLLIVCMSVSVVSTFLLIGTGTYQSKDSDDIDTSVTSGNTESSGASDASGPSDDIDASDDIDTSFTSQSYVMPQHLTMNRPKKFRVMRPPSLSFENAFLRVLEATNIVDKPAAVREILNAAIDEIKEETSSLHSSCDHAEVKEIIQTIEMYNELSELPVCVASSQASSRKITPRSSDVKSKEASESKTSSRNGTPRSSGEASHNGMPRSSEASEASEGSQASEVVNHQLDRVENKIRSRSWGKRIISLLILCIVMLRFLYSGESMNTNSSDMGVCPYPYNTSLSGISGISGMSMIGDQALSSQPSHHNNMDLSEYDNVQLEESNKIDAIDAINNIADELSEKYPEFKSALRNFKFKMIMRSSLDPSDLNAQIFTIVSTPQTPNVKDFVKDFSKNVNELMHLIHNKKRVDPKRILHLKYSDNHLKFRRRWEHHLNKYGDHAVVHVTRPLNKQFQFATAQTMWEVPDVPEYKSSIWILHVELDQITRQSINDLYKDMVENWKTLMGDLPKDKDQAMDDVMYPLAANRLAASSSLMIPSV